MNSKDLLRSLILYTLIPLIMLSGISGYYLYQVVLSDKLSHIENVNKVYEEFLQEKANHALATGDYPYFQETINALIQKEETTIISIELVDNDKRIVASAPENLPVHKKAQKIDIYNQASNDDLLNLDSFVDSETASVRIGYLVIRYNETHIEQAIKHVTYQLGILLSITLMLTLIIYRKIRHKIIKPYNKLENYLVAIRDGEVQDLVIPHNSNNGICHLIDQIKERTNNREAVIELMSSKIRRSKNETNEARISQYEMINELVRGLERPINLSRRLLSNLLDNTKNNDLKEDYYLLSGTIDDIANLVNDSRNLVNNPYTDYTNEPILVHEFYNNISQSTVDSNYKLLATKNIKNEILNSYILIDHLQIQLVVEKILQLSSQVCIGNEVYISVLIHEVGSTNDKARITIEIQDTSNGMSLEDSHNINRYLNNEHPLVDTQYFKKDDLKAVKHLKRLPNLVISISPEPGRGNYYRMSLECDLAQNKDTLINDVDSLLTHVVSIQEDPTINMLSEHYRMIGIDMNYVLFSKFESQLDYIINQDVLVLDVSTNYEQALTIFDIVNKHNVNIIAVINNIQGKDSILIDALYDKGAKDILRTKYSPESLAESVEKVLKNSNSVDEYISKKFLDKNS